jgi:hypothetical protein
LKQPKNDALFINLIDKALFQKWYPEITLKINSEFQLITIALLDSGIDMNYIQEWIVSTKYCERQLENYIKLIEQD